MKRVLIFLVFVSQVCFSQNNTITSGNVLMPAGSAVPLQALVDKSPQILNAFPTVDGTTLQALITANAGNECTIPAGTYTITSNLIVPSNIKIKGAGIGATVIKLSGAATVGFVVSNDTCVTISDLTLMGTYTAPNINSTAIINSMADLADTTKMGSEIGIYVTGTSQRVSLRNLQVKNFSKAGIYIMQAGMLYGYLGSVSGDNIISLNNFCGVYETNSGAYNYFTNFRAHSNIVGFYGLTSNMYFSLSSFNGNRVGMYANISPIGGGDSHTSISTTSFNHNILYSVAIDSTTTGWFFDNCQIYDAVLYLKRCRGFKWVGGRVDGTISIEGGGRNTIDLTSWSTTAVTVVSAGGSLVRYRCTGLTGSTIPDSTFQ